MSMEFNNTYLGTRLQAAKSPRAHEQEATDAKSYLLPSRGKSNVTG